MVTTGLKNGIVDGKSGVIEEMKKMCTEIVQTAQSELDIHSPSRKFDFMGEMSGEGYINGWRRSMENINAIIASSLPDAVMAAPVSSSNFYETNSYGKQILVNQDIKILAKQNDLLETTREFRQAQREAAEEW